eukprot:6993793-Pyramimonas_sp.AAC.1
MATSSPLGTSAGSLDANPLFGNAAWRARRSGRPSASDVTRLKALAASGWSRALHIAAGRTSR